MRQLAVLVYLSAWLKIWGWTSENHTINAQRWHRLWA